MILRDYNGTGRWTVDAVQARYTDYAARLEVECPFRGLATFGPESDQAAEKGVWMSVWVEDVDAIHQRCLEQGIEVTWLPTDMPWNVREMHVRHPD